MSRSWGDQGRALPPAQRRRAMLTLLVVAVAVITALVLVVTISNRASEVDPHRTTYGDITQLDCPTLAIVRADADATYDTELRLGHTSEANKALKEREAIEDRIAAVCR